MADPSYKERGSAGAAPRIPRRPATVARAVTAVAILAFLFGRIPVGTVLDAAASASVPALIAAFAIGLLAHVAVADRLRRLIEPFGVRISTGSLYRIHLATLFYGIALPAGNVAAIVSRFYQISKYRADYAGIGVALALERVVGVLSLCAVGIAFWLADRPASWPAFALMAGAFALGTAVCVLLFARGSAGPARSAVAGRLLSGRLAPLGRALRAARAIPAPTFLAVLVASIVAHLCGIAAFALVAGALGLELPLATIAWTRSAALLVAIVPISVAGLGVRETALVLLLAPYGVAEAEALAYSLLVFAVTVLAIGIVGGLLEARRVLR